MIAALSLIITIFAGAAAAILVYFLSLLVRRQAVFVPLPQATIEAMLKMADVRPDDLLFDLGCGDGRIVIAAAEEYGIRAIGIEKSRLLAWLALRKVRKRKLEDKAKIVNADFFSQDLSSATIVTVYLSQRLNNQLGPKLRRELREGARIVSADHTFNFVEKSKTRTGHFWTRLYVR